MSRMTDSSQWAMRLLVVLVSLGLHAALLVWLFGSQFRHAAQLTTLDWVDDVDDLTGGNAHDLAREPRIGAIARVTAQEVIGDAPSDPVELDPLADRVTIPRDTGFMQRQHFRG